MIYTHVLEKAASGHLAVTDSSEASVLWICFARWFARRAQAFKK